LPDNAATQAAALARIASTLASSSSGGSHDSRLDLPVPRWSSRITLRRLRNSAKAGSICG